MKLVLAFGLGLLMIACRPVARLDADVPPEVDRIALLTFIGDDFEATPLVPYDPIRGLPIERSEDGRAILVGYERTTLMVDDAALERPLVAASSCDDILPAPAWSVEWLDGARLQRFDPPALTIDREGTCAPIEPVDVRVESVCLSRRCLVPAVEIDAENQCRATVDLRMCGLGSPTLRLGDAPTYCVEDGAGDASPCPYTLHGPRRAFELDVNRVFVTDEPPTPIDVEDLDSTRRLIGAWIPDLTVVGADVLVVSRRSLDPVCETTAHTHDAVWIDRNSMTAVRRAPLPGCTMVVEAAPTPGEFFSASLRDDRFFIDHHDASGVLVSSIEVAVSNPTSLTGFDMITAGSGDRIVLLLTSQIAVDRSFLVIASLDPLAIVDIVEIDLRAFAMAAVGDNAVALAHGETFNVTVRDLATGNETRRIPTRTIPDLGRSLMGIHAEGLTIYTVGFDSIFRIGEDDAVDRVLDYASQAWPLRLAKEPGRDNFLVFATEIVNQRRDLIALRFDPGTSQWSPDVASIGSGVASRLEREDDGTLWIALPWTGEIARIRAAP